MNNWKIILPLFSIFTLSIFGISPAVGDNDDWERGSYTLKGPGAVYYRKECGSCHIAYPARFLQEASWKRMLSNLEDHFGENAELDPSDQHRILDYLSKHSAPSRWYKFWNNNSENSVPLRITQTRAFIHEHDELPTQFIAENQRVITLSQCDQCHLEAANGRFSEHQIHIPGMGRWYDD